MTATRGTVVTDPPRADQQATRLLQPYGVATVHEAIGREGYLGPHIRPVWSGAQISGTAVTVTCWPGDNLMIHVAVEQCSEGDVLVVTTGSQSSDGMFGELFATSLRARGVAGAVLTCGVRDTAALRAMQFPVWSAAVSAQGTVKHTPGYVNTPVTVGNTIIRPGDVIVADDDGVLRVPQERASDAVTLAEARVRKEEAARAAFEAGELGIDRYGLRERFESLGIAYVDYAEYADSAPGRGALL